MDSVVTRPEILAVIQARGGSKGVPRKNLYPVGGYPLIAYSIASGQAAETVTRLIVSTDDEEIADVARQYGAEVPFLRPAEFATDAAPDYPLFAHALEWLAEHESYRPQVVVQLRPTSPFRPRGLVDGAVRQLLADPEADCVRGVTRPGQNPYKMWRMGDHGYLAPLLDTPFAEPYNMPRQHLPPTFWQTGHIDAIRYETIVEKGTLTGERVLPIAVDSRYCIDIDTLQDFELADWLLGRGHLEIDFPAGPARRKRAWPASLDLLVLDFDGVFTDNRVWVLEDGREAAVCHRGDGMGLSFLNARGIDIVVLSTEVNPVVAARCRKLGLPCQHGLGHDKETALRVLAAEKRVDLKNVVYVGNDVNDLGRMRAAGYGIAVADAHPEVLQAADRVLRRKGGEGAIRELCDWILRTNGGDTLGKGS